MNITSNQTNIPNALIEYIINDIHDETDIKCVLRLLYLISCQPKSTPWITYPDFIRDEFMYNSQLSNNTVKIQKTSFDGNFTISDQKRISIIASHID